MDHGQTAQRAPSPIAHRLVRLILEDLSRPVRRPLGPNVEVGRLEEHGLVMIAAQSHLAPLNDQVQTLLGTRSVPDDVPQAIDFLDRTPVNVREDLLEGFEIRMDVRNDRKHARIPARKRRHTKARDARLGGGAIPANRPPQTTPPPTLDCMGAPGDRQSLSE